MYKTAKVELLHVGEDYCTIAINGKPKEVKNPEAYIILELLLLIGKIFRSN